MKNRWLCAVGKSGKGQIEKKNLFSSLMLKWIQSSVWWSVCYRILSERAIWHNLKILNKTLGSWKPTWEIWKNQVYFWSVWGSSAACTREWPHRYMSTTCRHVSIIQPTIREKIVPTGDVPATNKSQFLAFCDSSHHPIDFCWPCLRGQDAGT